MCFSATASFAAAGVLATIGTVSIARHRSNRYWMLAALPFVFAVQQATEGVVWVTMADVGAARIHQLAVYLYLLFALVVWPTWVPLSLYRAEFQPARRKRLRVLVGMGAVVSVYAVGLLIHRQPIASITGHSMSYQYQTVSRWAGALYLTMYLIPTIAPFLVSHLERAKLLGIAFLISLLTSLAIQLGALASVWCFLSAILSGLTLASIELTRRQLKDSESPVLAELANEMPVT